MHKNNNIKVSFGISDGTAEVLWAEDLGEGRFRILNSPFFINGINFEDIVSIKLGVMGQFEFDQIISRSGNSTYRIFSEKKVNDYEFDVQWKKLGKIGCTYESMGNKKTLLSVNVPKETDIDEVYKILEEGESSGIWEFEEGHYYRSGKK